MVDIIICSLKTVRQKAFMTRKCFAKELSVTSSTINRLEHGEAKSILTLIKAFK